MIEKYYNTPKLLNVAYDDDLAPWSEDLSGRACFDHGLYRGETVLHIAIVSRDRSLVRYLLRRGADLNARAIGVFFRAIGVFFVVD